MATTVAWHLERCPNEEEPHFYLSRPSKHSYVPSGLTYSLILLFYITVWLYSIRYTLPYVYIPFRHWKYSKIKINREIKYNQGSLPSAKKFVNKNSWVALLRRSLFFCKSFFCKAQSFTIHQWRTMVVVSFPF